MPCNHKPVIKFKNLLAKRPRYTCRHCDAEIEFTPAFSSINRSASMVLMMLLLLKVLGKNTSFGLTGTDKLLVDLGMMLGIVLIYSGAMLLLTRFGKFQEVRAEPEQPADQQPDAVKEQPVYTQEQLDLIAMYQEYERQAGTAPGEVDTAPEKIEIPAEVDTCGHAPAASWKNYIPGQYNFTCANCGKPITFPSAFKKKINMILMLITFAVILPFFSDLSLDFWIFGLLTLAVLVLGAVIQYFSVKKGRFELTGTK